MGDAATVRRAPHKFGLDTDPEDLGDHLSRRSPYMANLRTGLWKKVFSPGIGWMTSNTFCSGLNWIVDREVGLPVPPDRLAAGK